MKKTHQKEQGECLECKQEFERGLHTRNEFLNLKIKSLQSRLQKCEELLSDIAESYNLTPIDKSLIQKYFTEVNK